MLEKFMIEYLGQGIVTWLGIVFLVLFIGFMIGAVVYMIERNI